jgi:60 kDa SS-A/Ro ribonucleoprotein
MGSAVTGARGMATTAVTCKMAAALFASAFLKNNEEASIWPFNNNLYVPGRSNRDAYGRSGRCPRFNPRDSVMTNATILSNLPMGGTNCSLPLRHLNSEDIRGDVVIYLSDYESWMDARYDDRSGMLVEWERFRRKNKKAKLICIDLTPYMSKQVVDREDIFSIGGFSDHVFTLVDMFVQGKMDSGHWVGEIEKIEL